MGLVILLGTALRLHDLGGHSLWLDEIFTATFARADNSLATVIDYSVSTPIPAPPLWFIITHFFVKVMGSSEFVLRLPALMGGILGIAVTYRLGRMLFGRTEGIIAAFLLSVSSFHIYYSREARYYAALTLFSLLTLHYLYLAVNRRKWRWWAGFVMATIINTYIHLMAFPVLLAEMVFVGMLWVWQLAARNGVFVPKNRVAQPSEPTIGEQASKRGPVDDRVALAPVLLGLGTIVLSYVPMWPHVLRGLLGPRGLGNSATMEQLELSLPFVIKTFGLFGAGAGIAFALFMGAFVWGIAVSVSTRRRQILLTFLWIVIPFTLILLARPKHFFSTKYFIFVLPVYLMGAAAGIAEMGRSIGDFMPERLFGKANHHAVTLGTLVVVATFAVLCARAVDDAYAFAHDDWGDVGHFLQDNAASDDVVICLPVVFVTLPVEEVLSYYGPDPDQVDIRVTAWSHYLDEAYATHRRLWLVSTHYTWANRPADTIQWLEDKEYIELRFERGFRVLVIEAGMSMDALLTEAMGFSIPDASAWGSLARVLESVGRMEEAIAAYQKAIGQSPENGAWHARLGHVYYEQGQSDSAIAEYREAIRLAPDIPGFHSDLATVLRSSGDQRAALTEYRKALRLYLGQRRGTEKARYVQALRQAITELESGQ
jgi:tetratricopeptide (TPR) repeat protein